LSGVTPVARTIVLRRVLTGGISTNSGRVVFFFPSTDALSSGSWNGAGEGARGLVFGTLLGPETTGPWRGFRVLPSGGVRGCGVGLVFLVSWLHRSCMVAFPLGGAGVWGVWYGVVV
jgi:hypothetical protein